MYDLLHLKLHLKALHRYLFQDLYEWAGDLRTVDIGKADKSFMTPDDIGRPVGYIAVQISETHDNSGAGVQRWN